MADAADITLDDILAQLDGADLVPKEKHLRPLRNDYTWNAFKSHTVKPMKMIEKSRSVWKANPVMKTEKRLPNHKRMTWHDDDLTWKRPDMNKASAAWIYDNDRLRNKA